MKLSTRLIKIARLMMDPQTEEALFYDLHELETPKDVLESYIKRAKRFLKDPKMNSAKKERLAKKLLAFRDYLELGEIDLPVVGVSEAGLIKQLERLAVELTGDKDIQEPIIHPTSFPKPNITPPGAKEIQQKIPFDRIFKQDIIPIIIKCPSCGKKYEVPPNLLGNKFVCRECGKRFKIENPIPGKGEYSWVGVHAIKDIYDFMESLEFQKDKKNLNKISIYVLTKQGKNIAALNRIKKILLRLKDKYNKIFNKFKGEKPEQINNFKSWLNELFNIVSTRIRKLKAYEETLSLEQSGEHSIYK